MLFVWLFVWGSRSEMQNVEAVIGWLRRKSMPLYRRKAEKTYEAPRQGLLVRVAPSCVPAQSTKKQLMVVGHQMKPVMS